jgi:hypothetical protein
MVRPARTYLDAGKRREHRKAKAASVKSLSKTWVVGDDGDVDEAVVDLGDTRDARNMSLVDVLLLLNRDC